MTQKQEQDFDALLEQTKEMTEALPEKLLEFARQLGRLEQMQIDGGNSNNSSEVDDKIFKEGVRLALGVMGELVRLLYQFTLANTQALVMLADDDEDQSKR